MVSCFSDRERSIHRSHQVQRNWSRRPVRASSIASGTYSIPGHLKLPAGPEYCQPMLKKLIIVALLFAAGAVAARRLRDA